MWPPRNHDELLMTALSYAARAPLYTLRELQMMAFMSAVMDKPNWTSKVFDEVITQKWKDETVIAPFKTFSERMFQYCIDELQYKAKQYEETSLVTVLDADVVKSDTIISEQLRQSLIDAVKPLEDVPEKLKDWHPGSNRTVLDLVHPSMFPLNYTRTRVLPEGQIVSLDDCIMRCGEGEILSHPGHNNIKYSENFEWLPCEIDVSEEQPKITSYINNLHPHKNRDLYHVIEDYIRLSIPLWNQSLTRLTAMGSEVERIHYKNIEYDFHPDDLPEDESPQQGKNETDGDWDERFDEWRERMRDFHMIVKQPEPGPFSERLSTLEEVIKDAFYEDGTFELKKHWRMDLKSENAHRGLQVIVKLANIELTPENPEYGGGSWHVEGALNERIVATSLYYYSTENISTSTLSFRQASSTESRVEHQPQDEHQWLTQVFGLENEGPAVQTLGSVSTIQGRLLTFPNTLQHRVDPFHLADPSRPGHRKILALFLIDPNHRIVSTARVPCQRADWWEELLISVKEGRIAKLPAEVLNMILRHAGDYPSSLTEAEMVRERIIEERSMFSQSVSRKFEEERFCLCEH